MPQIFQDLKNLWNSLVNKKDPSKTTFYDPFSGKFVPIQTEGSEINSVRQGVPTYENLLKNTEPKPLIDPYKGKYVPPSINLEAFKNPDDYVLDPYTNTFVLKNASPIPDKLFSLIANSEYGKFTSQYDDFVNSLTDAELEAFLDHYRNDEGAIDYKAINSDLGFVDKLPGMPDSVEDTRKSYDELLADATAQLDPYYSSELADLKRLYDETEGLYNSQLNALNDQFRQSSSGLRSQQYLANAQTYDALRSDLRKSRQTALEAGASAGVRIAGNVNALLTAQNKQSATAMETSNALAEMLLQHRNAVSGMTRDFANYKTDYNSKVADVHRDYRTEARDNANYAAEGQDYSHGIKLSQYDTDMKEYEDSRSNLNPGQSVYSNYQRNKSYLK